MTAARNAPCQQASALGIQAGRCRGLALARRDCANSGRDRASSAQVDVVRGCGGCGGGGSPRFWGDCLRQRGAPRPHDCFPDIRPCLSHANIVCAWDCHVRLMTEATHSLGPSQNISILYGGSLSLEHDVLPQFLRLCCSTACAVQ